MCPTQPGYGVPFGGCRGGTARRCQPGAGASSIRAASQQGRMPRPGSAARLRASLVCGKPRAAGTAGTGRQRVPECCRARPCATGTVPLPDSVSQRPSAWHHPTGRPRETPACAPRVPPPRVPAPWPCPVVLQRLRGGRRVPGSRRARGSVWALIKRAVVMNELVRRVCMTMELPNYGF